MHKENKIKQLQVYNSKKQSDRIVKKTGTQLYYCMDIELSETNTILSLYL